MDTPTAILASTEQLETAPLTGPSQVAVFSDTINASLGLSAAFRQLLTGILTSVTPYVNSTELMRMRLVLTLALTIVNLPLAQKDRIR